jgi:hypothetical protein
MIKMLTKRQKRITRQIRIGAGIHKLIRELAFERGVTASKLVDEILLENPEVNMLLTNRIKGIKKYNKAVRKTISRDTEQTTEEFNKKTF